METPEHVVGRAEHGQITQMIVVGGDLQQPEVYRLQRETTRWDVDTSRRGDIGWDARLGGNIYGGQRRTTIVFVTTAQ
jgi:hypothetical protein